MPTKEELDNWYKISTVITQKDLDPTNLDKMSKNVQSAGKVIIRILPLRPIVLTVLKASMATKQMLSHLSQKNCPAYHAQLVGTT